MELPISTIVPSPEKTDDDMRALERAFVARESWAFEAAYRLHARSLMGAAYGVLHDAQFAQDCVHDVLTKLWQLGNAYRVGRGSLRAFLVVCVRNEALSRWRRDSNRARIEREIAIDPSYNERWGDPVESRRIQQALEHLNNEQRDAIELAYYKHMTYEEIARETHVPLGTIKSRISAALRRLRSLLASEESA